MDIRELDLSLEQIRTVRQLRPVNQDLSFEKQREDGSLIVSRYGRYMEIDLDGTFRPDRPLFS